MSMLWAWLACAADLSEAGPIFETVTFALLKPTLSFNGED